MEVEFENLQKLESKELELKKREVDIAVEKEHEILKVEEKCSKLLEKQSASLKKKYMKEVQGIYDEMKLKF